MGALLAGGLTGLMNQPTAQVIDGTLKFNGSNHYLNRTPGSGNRRTWTLSFWIKRGIYGTSQHIIGNYYNSANDGFNIRFGTDDKLQLFDLSSGAYTNGFNVVPTPVFRDNGWYHIVVALDTTQSTSTDRLKVYVNGTQVTSFSTTDFPDENNEYNFNTANSLSIGRGGSFDGQYFGGYLSNYYCVDGYALGPEQFGFTDPLTNTWRPKAYIKNLGTIVNNGIVWSDSWGGAGSTGNVDNDTRAFNGDLTNYTSNQNSNTICNWVPSSPIPVKRSLRVYAAAISSGNNQVFVNGTSLGTIPGSTPQWYSIQATQLTSVGLQDIGATHGRLYAVEVDGVILVDSSTSNSTDATYPFGTNGFWLPMDGNSPIGQDKSGKGNNFTPQNFSGTSVDPDVLKDSPSGAVSGRSPTSGITTTNFPPSNYATLNPLDVDDSTGTFVLANGNLEVNTFATNYSTLASTIAFDPSDPNGFYFESIGTNSAQYAGVGVAEAGSISSITGSPGRDGNAKQMLIRSDGYWYYNTGGIVASGKTTWTSSDVIGCAFKNNKIWVSKNGAYIESGDPVTEDNPNLTWDPANHVNDKVNFIVSAYTSNPTVTVNFGQKPFKYAPPDGFQVLNLANMRPETVITHPDQFVGITTWTGNGSSQSITGYSFSPDLAWIKGRSNARDNVLFDTVRGAEKYLVANSTADESTSSSTLTAFNADGFTLGGQSRTNITNETYVGWSWKAGGNKNTFNKDDVGYASAAAAGLSAGTITPTGSSVGTKQGFSIIKYTGNSTANATVPHGLSEAPNFVMIKNLDNSYGWLILHTDVGLTGTTVDGSPEYFMLLLESTGGRQNFSSDTIWNPTSTTVKIDQSGGANWVNNSNSDYIMYAWHNVPGLQKFGKYVGNGASGWPNAEGPFVELGFRPAVIIFKNTSQSENWHILDIKRDPVNFANRKLLANVNTEETQNNNHEVDFLSNGFKLRNNNGELNEDGDNYIYMAWAESPAVNLYGGQSNAR